MVIARVALAVVDGCVGAGWYVSSPAPANCCYCGEFCGMRPRVEVWFGATNAISSASGVRTPFPDRLREGRADEGHRPIP